MEKFFKGFAFALEGLVYTFKTQINFKFHIFSALIVVLFGFILNINKTEWFFVIFCIGWVLCIELLNTAIELLTDLAINKTINPIAKATKDIAAAAVLMSAIFSAIIGAIIFIPKLCVLVKYLV